MRIVNPNKQQLPHRPALRVRSSEASANRRISGLVTSIVDGNTFEISVHGQNGSTRNGKKHLEMIRIYGMDKPATSTLSGILAKLELEKMIVGRTLECEIIDKDDLDRLIAIVPSKYFRPSFTLNNGLAK